MKKIFTGFLLLAVSTYSYAELIQTTLTCRVETVVKRKDVVIEKKNETITVELSQLNDSFILGGNGELAIVFGTNDLRMQGVSNINDRSTDSILDVELSKVNLDPSTGKAIVVDISLRIDRVSGKLKTSNSYKALNLKNLVTGNCEKSNKKF